MYQNDNPSSINFGNLIFKPLFVMEIKSLSRAEMKNIMGGAGLHPDACGPQICCYYINPQNGTEQVSFFGQHTCCMAISGLTLEEMPLSVC
jgi:hypothetical protein